MLLLKVLSWAVLQLWGCWSVNVLLCFVFLKEGGLHYLQQLKDGVRQQLKGCCSVNVLLCFVFVVVLMYCCVLSLWRREACTTCSSWSKVSGSLWGPTGSWESRYSLSLLQATLKLWDARWASFFSFSFLKSTVDHLPLLHKIWWLVYQMPGPFSLL